MASTRTLTKSINMSFLQNNNKIIYVSLLIILSFFLFPYFSPLIPDKKGQVFPACPFGLFRGRFFPADVVW